MRLVKTSFLDPNDIVNNLTDDDYILIVKKDGSQYPIKGISKNDFGVSTGSTQFDCNDLNSCSQIVNIVNSLGELIVSGVLSGNTLSLIKDNGNIINISGFTGGGSFDCNDLNNCGVITGITSNIISLSGEVINKLNISGITISGQQGITVSGSSPNFIIGYTGSTGGGAIEIKQSGLTIDNNVDEINFFPPNKVTQTTPGKVDVNTYVKKQKLSPPTYYTNGLIKTQIYEYKNNDLFEKRFEYNINSQIIKKEEKDDLYKTWVRTNYTWVINQLTGITYTNISGWTIT
jgi:hypothetical protein